MDIEKGRKHDGVKNEWIMSNKPYRFIRVKNSGTQTELKETQSEMEIDWNTVDRNIVNGVTTDPETDKINTLSEKKESLQCCSEKEVVQCYPKMVMQVCKPFPRVKINKGTQMTYYCNVKTNAYNLF